MAPASANDQQRTAQLQNCTNLAGHKQAELHVPTGTEKLGYPFAIVLMALVSIVLYVDFRRRWI